ncbi:hypothetical protein TKK_0011024 [Trichogramma kaykai]|uniref:C2H2-type domain-containing protein n=1 Tax=Trichogramma kaykai TaxID=54128 RepID=A0ABD2WU51_9HYME
MDYNDIIDIESGNGTTSDFNSLLKNEEIDIDDSHDSDIEIVDIRKNIKIANKINKDCIRRLRMRIREKIRLKHAALATKSSSKEIIDLSDDSNYSDEIPILKKSIRKKLQDDSLKEITLNCPRCNKLDKVFCTTVTAMCPDCNIDMYFICNDCNLKYDSMVALYRHQKWQCENLKNLSKQEQMVKSLLICKCLTCEELITAEPKRSSKRLYCSKCNVRLSFECKICGKAYISYSGAYKHLRKKCQPQEKVYYCDSCSYKTICNVNFTHHIRNEHSDQIDSSELTNKEATDISHHKTFNSNSCETEVQLLQMRKMYCQKCRVMHDYEKRMKKCPNCKGSLLYKCGHCLKEFPRQSPLYRHVRRTHGEMKYVCDVCFKKYSFLGDLNEHVKRCGKKPNYSCNYCSFQTRYNYNLRQHIDKLHNIARKKHSCPDCNVTYKSHLTIMKHLTMGCKSK